jgi:epoxide hydrolase
MERFTVHVPDSKLDDLHERLARTRFPDQLSDAGWSYGTELGYLRELVAYWRDGYDWRAQERALNSFDHFTAPV